MPYVKNTAYRNILFSSETRKDEFYTFSIIPELAAKSEKNKIDIFYCRTVGILHSNDGRFYLTDIDGPTIEEDKPLIRVTMKYLKIPPQSLVVPYPVQIFGTLQWKNRPVIYAKILQILTTQIAIRIRDTLNAVVKIHLATSVEEETDFEVSFSELNDTFVIDTT